MPPKHETPRSIVSHLPKRPRVSVVIPTLNEAENLPYVLSQLSNDVYEVILVDGNSTDGTIEVARSLCPGVTIVTQTGRGKGDALECGFCAASGDIIVTIDADGSMDPSEIPAMVTALLETGSDYAKGSRVIDWGRSDDLTAFRRLGNFMLRTLVNVLYGTRYTDLCYGFNAFWHAHVDRLGFGRNPQPTSGLHPSTRLGSGFEVETCMNIRAARAGLRIIEVPSHESKRINGSSNLRVLRDGFRVLRSILTEWRRPRPPAGDALGVLPGGRDVQDHRDEDGRHRHQDARAWTPPLGKAG